MDGWTDGYLFQNLQSVFEQVAIPVSVHDLQCY